MRSMPTRETRTQASITMPLSRTRSSTSMRLVPVLRQNVIPSRLTTVTRDRPKNDHPIERCRFSVSGGVTGEDEVASLGLLVAGKAGLHERLVARFAVHEVSESPAARRGVLCRVLDHELNVRGRPGNERLGPAKDLVVFL